MTSESRIKTVIIGEVGSGKSSIINRLLFNKYDNFLNSTIGTHFLIKNSGENNKLEIWDTTGQERYRSLLPLYLRNAVIVCIVVSLDKNEENIENEKQYWLNYLHHNNTMLLCYKKLLIYNKSDLNVDFMLDNDKRFDFSFIVSCKNNTGIDKFSNYLDTMFTVIKKDDIYTKTKNQSCNYINMKSSNKKKCSLL